MKTENLIPRQRMSAGERREEILQAAVAEFALTGLHGTSTETIARRAGISQPYLFRLFGTKKELFLAVVERGFDRVRDRFQLAVEANPREPLEAMGRAYGDLLRHRDELLLQMQSYAACGDEEIAAVVRRRYGELYELVERLSGGPPEAVREFFAHGMLLNVAASMNLLSILDEEWVRNCLQTQP